jgi:hypothetical protein
VIDPGLCRDCVEAQRIESARGSVFVRCRVHDRDPSWPKYPRLPVQRCVHHRAEGAAGERT